ncbi:ribulose-phosphate 3 epimerase family protein, partial [Chlamydia psittaci 84-8471/1]
RHLFRSARYDLHSV